LNNTVKSWLSKSRDELDEIYRNATPGKIPNGDTQGTAILAGSIFAQLVALLSGLFAWQGKVFDVFCPCGEAGVLVNKTTPFSLTFIVAKVYRGISWLDGKDTIVIDYSHTSFFAKVIRDEIREVEPSVYLGKVWWGEKRILDFALTQTNNA
jgi:hypothetical protein